MLIKLNKKSNNKIKIIVEVCSDTTERRLRQENMSYNTYSENQEMTDLDVDLPEVTYYLIRYSCTQTKWGKILSILAFKYANDNQRLFEEGIYKYSPECGTLIKELATISNISIYTRDIPNENPDGTIQILEELNDNKKIPIDYKNTDRVPLSVKKDIEDVFRNFGAYPADVLGHLLNPIVDKIVNPTTNEIDLTKIKEIEN